MRLPAALVVALSALLATDSLAGLPVAYHAELKAFVRSGDPLGFSLYGTADCSDTPVYSQILGAGTPQVIVEQVAPVRAKKGDKTPKIARELASVEERCQDLGATCLCSEPLQATTHSQTSGPYDDIPWDPAEGQTTWLNYVDPDDSRGAKECYGNDALFPHSVANGGTWMYFDYSKPPPTFVTGESERTRLPNNTLSSIMKYGPDPGVAHSGEPSFNVTEPNHTYCMRGYSRWEGRGNWISGSPTQQSKILTFIGNNQISMEWYGGEADGPKIVAHRVDGRWGLDGQEWGQPDLLNFDECVLHWCRFEVCMDHFLDGTSQSRYQVAVIGTPMVINATSVRSTVATNTFTENAFQGAGFMYWTQDGLSVTRLFTHVMVAIRDGVDTSFFIGAACEVEGGCTGRPHP